ncbi:hypothetical protein [Haloferula chungangensis]
MERVIEPEIIDGMAPDHPMAIRSRRDLRMINFIMGNERWIRGCVKKHRASAAKGIVELGAGGGELLGTLASYGPSTGYDLVPKPEHLGEEVSWKQGDLWAREAEISGGILVANLFLHHLQAEELGRLGDMAKRFDVLIFVEPLRTKDAEWMGERLLPIVGEATKHDMMVSIRAGFVAGELPELLGLGSEWKVSERSTWRGGHRVLALRA